MSRIKSPFQKWLYRNRTELKVALALCCFLLVWLVYFKFFYVAPIPSEPQYNQVLEAQERGTHFLQNHLVYKRGMIKQFDPNRPQQNQEYLSETLGLWMLYLVESDHKKLFSDQYDYLKNHFLAPRGWVYWRIENDHPNSCNATLDDLRIAYALNLAGQKWKMKKYNQMARQLAQTLKTLNLRDNNLVESYCENPLPEVSPWVDLSYLDLLAIESLQKFDKDWGAVLYRSQKLLYDGKTRVGFYYDKYDVLKNKYGLKDMNLINQLICALNEESLGSSSKDLYEFLKTQYLKKGKVWGRYHPVTLKPLVDFESPAVYGLFLSLAVLHDDRELAEKLKDQLLKMQNKNGSFGSAPYEAFDHILILTGLRHYQTHVFK
jgi:hypothetical protein